MAIADIIAADRVVCRCLGITESEIRSALMEGTAECLRTIMRETAREPAARAAIARLETCWTESVCTNS